jgi:aminocarboxymuconate-semialdehyde decarboxylase
MVAGILGRQDERQPGTAMSAELPPLRFGPDGAADTSRFALDVHAHLVPVNEPAIGHIAGVEWLGEKGMLSIDGHALGMRDLFHPRRLLSWMDEHHVARALISVPPPAYRQQLGVGEAQSWAQYLNEGLLAIAARYPDRFGALLHLPMEQPAVATDLAIAAPREAAGFAIAAGGAATIDFAASACEPLWREMDRRGSFVFIHPGQCCDGRLATFYLENLLGNPYETTVAASRLVMAAVPARYPNIRFCLAHAGGFFPAACGRLERGVATSRPGIRAGIEPPLAAARRFRADCIAHHPAGLSLARSIFGDHHIMFGSDWPFPMGLPQPASLESCVR